MGTYKTSRGNRNGWSARSLTTQLSWCLMLVASAAVAEPPSSSPASDQANYDLIAKALFALGGVVFAQAVIPLIRFLYQKRKLRKTYRAYLQTHVDTTLRYFQGAGSTHFAQQHLVDDPEADWLTFLHTHKLGVPEIFVSVQTVIKKALTDDKYIPSVSYFGPDGHPLDPASTIWELDDPRSKAALEYFITQQQVEKSLEYQYTGWYFDLIKSDNKKDRERWCKGLEDALYDLAQHYRAARRLDAALGGRQR